MAKGSLVGFQGDVCLSNAEGGRCGLDSFYSGCPVVGIYCRLLHGLKNLGRGEKPETKFMAQVDDTAGS